MVPLGSETQLILDPCYCIHPLSLHPLGCSPLPNSAIQDEILLTLIFLPHGGIFLSFNFMDLLFCTPTT